MKPEVLFHGSTVQNLKLLKPVKRYTPDGKIDYEAIYATPLPAYAAVHAFPWGSNEGFDLDVINGIVEFVVPIEHKTRLNVPVSIYTISLDGFEFTKEEIVGYTWHSVKEVKVIKEEVYNSVIDAVSKFGGVIKYK